LTLYFIYVDDVTVWLIIEISRMLVPAVTNAQFCCPVLMAYYRVGQKNRTCLSIDNSAMVSVRKTYYTSKVSECCKE